MQCPKDALFFEDEAGTRIEPDVIHRYKLHLLGQRRMGCPRGVGPGLPEGIQVVIVSL